MVNCLKMKTRQQVLTLLELGWTYRWIQAETGVRRETVARYDRMRRANAEYRRPCWRPGASRRGSSTLGVSELFRDRNIRYSTVPGCDPELTWVSPSSRSPWPKDVVRIPGSAAKRAR
jgi:hypothetical protein